MSAAAASSPTHASADTRRAVLNTVKGSLGNLVEWYDVYVYTVFATYFESQFFDPADENSTIYVYAIFAVTFLMRPVGSWFFGRFADRRGRRAALTVSVSLMAACSFVVAIMPTRGTIGVWAAVILVIARLLQGFATGGEYGASATYMSETATRERRGFLSSFQYVTLVGGHALAQLTLLILLLTLDKPQISDFGWRIGFFIGGVAAIVVFWLRRTMDETLSAEHLEATKSGADRSSGSLRELFTAHWRPLLLTFFITMGGTLAFYVYTVNAPAVIKTTYGTSPITSTLITLAALIFLIVLQPIGGLLSDKIGRKPLLVFFGVGGTLFTYVLVTYLPKTTNIFVTSLLIGVGFIILTGYTSINAIVKAELFPAHIRALGVGLGYALANSTFGGTAPLLYAAAKKAGNVPEFIWYSTATIFGSLIVYVFFLKNKSQTHLDAEQGHAYEMESSRG